MSTYRELADEFYKYTKRVIKSDLSTNEDTLNQYKSGLIESYNNLVDHVRGIKTSNNEIIEKIRKEIKQLRVRLIEAFRRLRTKIDLGSKLLDRVRILEETDDEFEDASGSEPLSQAAEENVHLLKDIHRTKPVRLKRNNL